MPRFTQQNFRDELRDHLGVDDQDDGFNDAGVDLLLNRAWWEIADMFKFREAETSFPQNTVIGTLLYAVQSDLNGLQLITIEDLNSNQHTPLQEMMLIDYETEFADRTDSRGKPTHYIRRGSGFSLYPTPDAVYEIISYYKKTLADIINTGVTVPLAWDEVILYGAIWRGFAKMGDYNRRGAAKSTQMELLGTKETTETKEKVNRPLAGVQMIRPRYP